MVAALNRPAIVLAAGHGRRFGGNKQLARLPDGRLLLEQTLTHLRAATDRILLVIRPDLAHPMSEALPELWNSVVVVECPEAELGMGHSLAAGVTALPQDSEGCLICLGDMPWIRPDTYRRLLDTLDGDGILIPEYQGRPGHPVGFGQRLFDELRGCRGDRGARDVIRQHPTACRRLAVEDEGILRDVDTPADMREHGLS